MQILDLNVKIEFDPEKGEITGYTTTLNGITEKKTTTTKKSSTSSKTKDISEDSLLIREDNKLVLSKKLVEELGAQPEDRIAICYQKDNDITYPVIGLETNFGGRGSGNKLTKSNTIACRGGANFTLAEFGTKFTVVPHSEGIFKLVGDSIVEKKITPEQAIKKVDLGIEITSDETYEIEDLDFTL